MDVFSFVVVDVFLLFSWIFFFCFSGSFSLFQWKVFTVCFSCLDTMFAVPILMLQYVFTRCFSYFLANVATICPMLLQQFWGCWRGIVDGSEWMGFLRSWERSGDAKAAAAGVGWAAVGGAGGARRGNAWSHVGLLHGDAQGAPSDG